MPVARAGDHCHDRAVTFSARRLAGWLCGLGGVALALSLFLSWTEFENRMDAWRLFDGLDAFLAGVAVTAVGAAFVPIMRPATALAALAALVAVTVKAGVESLSAGAPGTGSPATPTSPATGAPSASSRSATTRTPGRRSPQWT
jgi:hypothetical protein